MGSHCRLTKARRRKARKLKPRWSKWWTTWRLGQLGQLGHVGSFFAKCGKCVPSGNLLQFAIENGHRNSVFSHEQWWFSIAMLVYQRVYCITGWWFGTWILWLPQELGWWSNLTFIFFRGAETTNQLYNYTICFIEMKRIHHVPNSIKRNSIH